MNQSQMGRPQSVEWPALSSSLTKPVDDLVAAASPEAPINIICGAGVSVDAGLPLWNTLVDRMANDVLQNKPELLEVFLRDPASVIRKVEYLRKLSRSSSTRSMIQGSLYRPTQVAPSGRIATNLAAIVAHDPRCFRVMTTNYDDVLERALRAVGITPKSFDPTENAEHGYDTWCAGNGKHECRILHLHGYIPREDAERERFKGDFVVLAESDYFGENGIRVKQCLLEQLRERPNLFVGVSLVDPSLLAPLASLSALDPDETGSQDGANTAAPETIVVSVADAHVDEPIQNYQYAQNRAIALSEPFPGLRTVNLKTYGQVAQLLGNICVRKEMASDLANTSPALDADASVFESYGLRLNRVLTAAYAELKMLPLDKTEFESRIALSNKLFSLLRSELTSESGFFGRLIDEVDDLQPWRESLMQERFAMFLWLRSLPITAPNSHRSNFGIDLLGTSMYVHREEWSIVESKQVTARSQFYAARAAYFGRTQVDSGNDKSDASEIRPRNRHLKSAVHVPLWVEGVGPESDRALILGAITLDSNAAMLGNEVGAPSDSIWRTNRDMEIESPLSVFNFMRVEDFEELERRLIACGLTVCGLKPAQNKRGLLERVTSRLTSDA